MTSASCFDWELQVRHLYAQAPGSPRTGAEPGAVEGQLQLAITTAQQPRPGPGEPLERGGVKAPVAVTHPWIHPQRLTTN